MQPLAELAQLAGEAAGFDVVAAHRVGGAGAAVVAEEKVLVVLAGDADRVARARERLDVRQQLAVFPPQRLGHPFLCRATERSVLVDPGRPPRPRRGGEDPVEAPLFFTKTR